MLMAAKNAGRLRGTAQADRRTVRRRRRRRPADADFVDAAALRLEHFDRQTVEIERLADAGHPTEPRQDVAADRFEPLGLDLDPEAVAQLVEADLRAEHVGAVALVDDRLALHVVFVADLADDLLD